MKYFSIRVMTLKQQAKLYNVVHLIHVCRNEKGLLNFVSERIKLVYRINLLGISYILKGAFQTSKTTVHRPHTSEFDQVHI